MNNTPRGYAWEKLSVAMKCLIGDGPLKQRLLSTRVHLSLLAKAEGNVPEHSLESFHSIRQRLDELDGADIPTMESLAEALLELFTVCLKS